MHTSNTCIHCIGNAATDIIAQLLSPPPGNAFRNMLRD
jgi:hypothetical protein